MLSGLVGFFALLASDDDGFIFLDYVNLVFHEAGHPLFGLFGETVGLYGGTLGQLAMPFLVWLVFWGRRDTLGCAVAGVWFFENVLNIARYMADARSQILRWSAAENMTGNGSSADGACWPRTR